jgi:hypothetical protein
MPSKQPGKPGTSSRKSNATARPPAEKTAARKVAKAAAAAGAARVAAAVKKGRKPSPKDPPCSQTPAYSLPVEVTLRFRGKGGEEVLVQLDPARVSAVAWTREAVNELTRRRTRDMEKRCPPGRPGGVRVLKSAADDEGDDGAGVQRMMLALEDGRDDGGRDAFGGCYLIDGQIICWGGSMA